MVLGIVKASLEILGIGIGVKKVALLISDIMDTHKKCSEKEHSLRFPQINSTFFRSTE